MNRRIMRHVQVGGLVVGSVIGLTGADTGSLPSPPVAKKLPHISEVNGHKMEDNYFWLRDKPNPEVRAYLEAENAYTDAVMKPTEPFQGKLYAIRCRRKGSKDAAEEVVLDVNEMAKGQVFMTVNEYAVSPDGNLLAYSYDNTGFRQFTLAVKDLRTGKTLLDHAERVGSVVWANDNQTIFYTQEDAVAKRQYRLYRHTAGTAAADALVYEEKDERFEIGADRTRSGAYIFLVSGSHTTSEARYIPADQPMAEWKVVEPRKQDVQYYPDHNGDSFYIRVNDTGRNFRLVKAPVGDAGSKNWKEVVAHDPNVMLNHVEMF